MSQVWRNGVADEVTQEVFIDLWRRPEQFDAARGSRRTLLLTKTHGKAVQFRLDQGEIALKSVNTGLPLASHEVTGPALPTST